MQLLVTEGQGHIPVPLCESFKLDLYFQYPVIPNLLRYE